MIRASGRLSLGTSFDALKLDRQMRVHQRCAAIGFYPLTGNPPSWG
jgi:hypothetical protein